MRVEEWLRLHWWVLVLLAITLAGTLGRETGHPPVAAALAGVAVLALLLRAERPEATVLVNAAATGAYFGLEYAAGPVYLSIFFAAYALAVRCPAARWWPYVLAYAVPVAGMAGHWAADHASSTTVTLRSSWFLALLAASLAVGSAMRGRGETRRERAARAATEERLRMAEDLHDGVGHGLAVIAMQAGVALHVLEKDPSAVRASLEAIRDTSRESLEVLRSSLSRLAPSGAAEAAPRSPRHGLDDLDVLLARVRAGGLDVTADIDPGLAAGASGEVGETAYAVVQEALTNVLRHAAASTAQVRLGEDGGGLLVGVRDDGRGGAVDGRSAGEHGSGLGIPGMRARVERLGGTLEAGPVDSGFAVRAWIPLDGAQR
ncbi:sensor histidine kinase [Nocardioides sp. KR10-350]|uniref:sensor histidine kinase n=1 Tax=Nocardioides cheoyonin TaxID=3156615 RepID=UPI0032B3DD03